MLYFILFLVADKLVEIKPLERKDGVDFGFTDLAPPDNLMTNKPLSASRGSLRSEDNESSATMSADEAPPTSSHAHMGQDPHDSMTSRSMDTAGSRPMISQPVPPGPGPFISSAITAPGGGITQGRPIAPPLGQAEQAPAAGSGREIPTIKESPPVPVSPASGQPKNVTTSGPFEISRPSSTPSEGHLMPPTTNASRVGSPSVCGKQTRPACVRDLINSAIERNLGHGQERTESPINKSKYMYMYNFILRLKQNHLLCKNLIHLK